jgi:hypothetical protein
MEISEVRKRLRGTIDRARRSAAEQQARADQAASDYHAFLETVAVPLFRQVAGVLKAQSYPFAVFTPAGSVRLASERSGENFIELSLDTSGPMPAVIGRTSRARGGRVLESERQVGSGPIRDLSAEQVLDFLDEELGPFVEK